MTVSTSQSFDIGFVAGTDLVLRLRSGACHLRVTPGRPGTWVGVRYEDPSGGIPIDVSHENGQTTLQVGSVADFVELLRGVPTLELALGNLHPYALVIESGAGDSELELGGLPLTSVTASLGAGSTTISFGAPNPVQMSKLRLSVGAGRFRANGLANAGFAEMIIEGAAAGCLLDFSGALRRDAAVRVSAAVSTAELMIPESVPAEVTAQSLLGGMTVHGPFTRKGNFYLNAAAEAGRRPVLRVTGAMAIGNLHVFSE